MFNHLESCTGPKPKPQRTVASVSSSIYSQQRQPTKPPDRLPTINYSMYKDQALRKKLADLGISNQGTRALLERRHKEWMTIWNSNCDAARPRTRHELLHDLDVWERTLGGRAPTTGRAIQNAAMIKDKDFDGAAWAAKHDTSFKDLIANARKTRLEAKKKAEKAARETEMEEATKTLPQAQEPEASSQHKSSGFVNGQPSMPFTTTSAGDEEMTHDTGGLVVPHMTGSTGTTYQLPSHGGEGVSNHNEHVERPPTSQPTANSVGEQPVYMHRDGSSQDTTMS